MEEVAVPGVKIWEGVTQKSVFNEKTRAVKRLQLDRHDPEARRVSEGNFSEVPDSEKVMSQCRESIMHATERRWTVDEGMKRTLFKMICAPLLTTSHTDPMPTAEMEEPLTPLTRQFVMCCSCRKSLHSSESWVVQPLLRRKGDKDSASLGHFVGVQVRQTRQRG